MRAAAVRGGLRVPHRSVAPVLAWAGWAAIGVPTLLHLANDAWNTEEGSYGLIVLAIGLWLVLRRWPLMRQSGIAGRPVPGWGALVLCLAVHVVARITAYVPLEVASLYGAVLAALYLHIGGPGMRPAAFPLFYLALAIPIPPQIVEITTTRLRLEITAWATRLLDGMGLMIANEGLDIYVDQYHIAVARACSGLNSMISLTAIGLFYVYARGRRLSPLSAPVVIASILACAAAGNFARVVAIVLLTHFAGEGVAQGPLHEFTGLITFTVALAGVMLLDRIAYRHLPSGRPFDD